MITATLHNAGNRFMICMVEDINAVRHEVFGLCNKQEVDGLILVQKKEQPHFYETAFFNSDGSPFMMCFNGSLCTARFIKQLQGTAEAIWFVVPRFGVLEARFSDETVSLLFEAPIVQVQQTTVCEYGLQGGCYSLLLTDNHKVILTEQNFFNDPRFLSLAAKLRCADHFFPEGCNVHFVFVHGEWVYIRHFEKGIERETLSCGSGCVAAGIVMRERKKIEFISAGGKLLLEKISGTKWMLSGEPQTIQVLLPRPS